MPKSSIHVLATGERMPILLDDQGLPLFYPTLFVTSQLRNSGAAVNTIRNALAEIAVLMRWENRQERDLVSEFQTGRFLEVSDVVSIRDFAKLDMREQKLIQRGRSEPKVVTFLESQISSGRAAAATVSSQQHFNRMSTIASYLSFTATVVNQHRNSSQTAKEIARMTRMIRKHRPRVKSNLLIDDVDYRSPPFELIDRFMEIGAEGHPENPFINPEIQLRNAIIFGLLRQTGMRRGELLSLRLDQIDLNDHPKVRVRRNHDDRFDSRRYQPVTKTKERYLPITDELANQLDRYIMEIRRKIPSARRHPYLLVSHKGPTIGRPLSISGLSGQVFDRMKLVDPQFENIHPHSFRHHFNHKLSISIDQLNAGRRNHKGEGSQSVISHAREKDLRAYINGHRDKESGATYIQRHVREESDKAARKVQSEMGISNKKWPEGKCDNEISK